jgi:Xaa-Pro aminopeptidase
VPSHTYWDSVPLRHSPRRADLDYEGRATRLRERLEEASVEALLVSNLSNVRYLTGFSGTNGFVLVTRESSTFFSDPRYAARAADLVEAADVAIYPSRLTELLGPRLAEAGITRLGIEGATMTLAERDDLADRLADVELLVTKGVVEDLRRKKDADEVALVAEAVALGDETFSWVVENLQTGISERALALEIEMHMRTGGADGTSFDPIVGSGPLSGHIHHTPSDRVLEKGDLVLLDFGCRLNGYCSDLTRTVVLGPATDAQRETYETVLAAQQAGIRAVTEGVGGRDADAAARAVIDNAGHGENFGHGLGHGVGLDVHEAPRLHRVSEDTLEVGDVVTVEPGIYDASGGVRIEDCVVVTDAIARVLTSAPKNELIEI